MSQHNQDNKDKDTDESSRSGYDMFILILKILAPIILIALLLLSCSESKVPDRPTTQRHKQARPATTQPVQKRRPDTTHSNTSSTSNTRIDTSRASHNKSTQFKPVQQVQPAQAKPVDPLANITSINDLPGDYKLRMAQIADILNMMLDIRLTELENKGFSKAEIEMMHDGYRTIYSATHTSPKVIIQLNHILMERDRALAQQLTIDYTAYKADSNLVDIVRFREKKPIASRKK